MDSPVQNEAPGAALTDAEQPPSSRTVARDWTGRIALHALQAAIYVAAVGLTGPDPVLTALACAVTAWVHWLAFVKANPRLVGLELIALILATYYHPALSRYAVLWVAAGALAGGTGAWLTLRGAREDDFFFLPAGMTVAAYGFLVWLAEGCRVVEPLRAADRFVRFQYWLNAEALRAMPNWDRVRSQLGEETAAWLPYVGMLSVVAFWALGLWLAGRLARRWAGRMDLRRGSLILFRLEQRYIFLLICGIVLWIVGILTGGEKYALYAAGPILTVFAIACFLEGLAVILFYLALWRTTAAPVPYRLLAIMAMIAALFLTFISLLGCMLLGLSDIWFDYRRLKAVEERLGLDR